MLTGSIYSGRVMVKHQYKQCNASMIIELSDFDVTENAMRPASDKRECFYCHQGIGAKHQAHCVLIRKTVKVRVVVEYEVDMPSSWDAQQIEFHRNEGSWCADNMIGELERFMGDDGCLCPITQFKHLEDVSGPHLEED